MPPAAGMPPAGEQPPAQPPFAQPHVGMPVFDPSREKRIFARMKEDNPGPLDDEAIVRMFERVVDESRRLERITSHKEED